MAPGAWENLRAAPTVVQGTGREAMLEAEIAFEASGFKASIGMKVKMLYIMLPTRMLIKALGILRIGGARGLLGRLLGERNPNWQGQRVPQLLVLGHHWLCAGRHVPTIVHAACCCCCFCCHIYSTPPILNAADATHAAAGSAMESSRPVFGPTSGHPTELHESSSGMLLGSAS